MNKKLLLIIPFAILNVCVYEITGTSMPSLIITSLFLIYCLYMLISVNLEEKGKNNE